MYVDERAQAFTFAVSLRHAFPVADRPADAVAAFAAGGDLVCWGRAAGTGSGFAVGVIPDGVPPHLGRRGRVPPDWRSGRGRPDSLLQRSAEL